MSKYNNHKLMCLDLELILTQKCNLSCAHCLRGCSDSKEISEEVLDETFKKFIYIENLSLGGGEITLVPDKIKLVVQKLKEHNVIIHHANFTSNGTIVSNEVLDALTELRDYVVSCNDKPSIFKPDKKEVNVPLFVCFSFDDYHLDQIIQHGISAEQLFNNIAIYQQRFGEESIQCRLECDMDVYDMGRATNLPPETNKFDITKILTLPYPFIESKTQEALLLGNIICVSCDGEVIPVNISFESEKCLSFGNIKHDGVSTLLSNMNAQPTDNRSFNNARNKLFKMMTAPKNLQKRYKPILTKKLRAFYYNLELASQNLE